ncbi:hypothetical protein psyc5s11_36810 [Clostridium gelidum]|uniref:AAA+ ATPase domain-containing protein n=1 Tax=Clostridium gelidum TaxID=704125 RepID=A0ABM7T8H1_9CLOT|nr:AAA family ATPase [Clostridium gelidum]BCZ47614.1 hypothetical protein psyc5s11_36810 [Clostridium gelidum]
MSNKPTKFTTKLIFPKCRNTDYSATILLCKDIPTFIETNKEIKYNQLELNDKNFNTYYHKFLFIANKALQFKGTKLTYNDEAIVPEFLHKIFISLHENNADEKSNKEVIKTTEIQNSLEIKNEKILKQNEIFSIEKESSSESSIDKLMDEITKTKTTEERKRNIPKVTFVDIGGIDNVLQEIRESVELPLKAPQIFKHLGIKPHKGILLYGEPGCGKTLIAKAIANETNAHFISIKASELMSMWHGLSESNLRKIFEEAKERQPSVIYFDEIDSVGRKRTGDERERFDAKFLTQLLSLMDGVEDYGDICVIGSTNRIDILDEALLRSGRFDLKIEIEKPDQKGCLDILNKVIREMPIDKTFDRETFSYKLVGLSGADITFIATEAGYNCMRRNIDLENILKGISCKINLNKLNITVEDFNKALEKVSII